MKRCIDESAASLTSDADTTDLSPEVEKVDECIDSPSSEVTDIDDDMFRTRLVAFSVNCELLSSS